MRSLDVDDVQGIAAFFAGFGTANLPIGGGCSVNVSSPVALGLAIANANGIASLPIPSRPTLLGITIHRRSRARKPARRRSAWRCRSA